MASCTATTPFATVDYQDGGTDFSAVHSDIIQNHILNLLDGPTLASAACASSQLHALSTEEKLWRNICASTWPSIDHPRLRHLISSFPAGYRSFFSDSFPALDHLSRPKNPDRSCLPPVLLSAVDVHYEDELIFSRVLETQTWTKTGWFLCAPFHIDLLGQKETIPTSIRNVGDDQAWLKHLEENLTLSWIVIDQTRKRAVNVSSRRPVSVERHWLTGDIQLRYAMIMAGNTSTSEFVQCGVVVKCGGKVGTEMHVTEVSLLMEDMEGKHLNGRDSLVVLRAAMESGKRKKERRGEAKERFEGYLEMRKVWRETKKMRDRAVDMLCSLTIFVVFLYLVFFR